MQAKLRFTVLGAALCISFMAAAQTVVKGKLVDAESGEPLIGAQIKIVGSDSKTITDDSGNFTLQNPTKARAFSATYIGFKSSTFSIGKSGRVGTISLQPDDVFLEGITVSGTLGLDRKTPVALSNVSEEEIQERLGTQEFPEILKSTPGVHANKVGGGWGDSEIWMRGFDNSNIAVMVNGVPMNDMENGLVYWSNWGSIGDVTRNLQTQRGLGASKVSAPSVGGTINIITKSLEQKRGGHVTYQMGNDGANKIAFSVSTGMTSKGWGMTLLGARNWGDGYVQGTDYSGYTWFASVAKRFNDQHTLSFTGFGTKQEHGQRPSSYTHGPLLISEWQRVEAEYGVKDFRYNPNFGYYHGEKYNAMRNSYHKPQLSLNHDWTINDHSSLSTALYMSIGRGNGTTAEAHAPASYTDVYGASNGLMTTAFRRADGLFDYDALYERNVASQEGSLLAMCKNVNDHLWTGLISTYSTQFGKFIDFYGGIDFRHYKGDHSTEITDLFGGKYFMDDYDRGKVNVANNAAAANPAWVYKKLNVGDKVYRDYSGYVEQIGAFGQAEYNRGPVSSFVSGALNNTTYWRRDRLYYDKQHEKSNMPNFIGGNVKAGANYNFDDHHNAFFNIGYISRAPKFNAAFMQFTTSNVENKDAKNEKILSFEVGYGWRCSWAQLKVNGYFTKWMDKEMTKYLTLGNQETGYMNMGGVDAKHMGIELEGKVSPVRWLDVKGMLSLGDWKWNSIGEGYVYNEHGHAVDDQGFNVDAFGPNHAQGRVNLKGVRVGGSAQTTASLGFEVKFNSFKAGADWTYYGRNYSYYSLNSSNITVKQNATTGEWTTTNPQEPWRVPDASQVDLHASYKFDVCKGMKATLSGTVNNLFDYQYIGKAYNNSTASAAASADNVYVFYNFGRTYSIRLRLNF